MYWFAYFNLESPSVRYRAYYPFKQFEENHGVRFYFVIPGYSGKRILNFLKTYMLALVFRKKDSLIVVQRVNSNNIYAKLLKILVNVRNKNTVYDLDDADYLEYPPETIYYFAKRCHKISSGSHEISETLEEYNSNIVHTPSPIVDLNVFKHQRNDMFTIGWIGGFHWGHQKSLETLIFPAIKQLPFPCKFVLLGVEKDEDIDSVEHYFKSCKHVELCMPKSIDWNNEEEIQTYIMTFDLGIATLLDNGIQRAKSGIKAKQYMNNGIPVLCNDLPENNKVVKHGVNGYHCDSVQEFRDRMVEFKHMSDSTYQRFSEQARESIIHFNHEYYYNAFQEIINL